MLPELRDRFRNSHDLPEQFPLPRACPVILLLSGENSPYRKALFCVAIEPDLLAASFGLVHS
jgi:hypothetical protein